MSSLELSSSLCRWCWLLVDNCLLDNWCRGRCFSYFLGLCNHSFCWSRSWGGNWSNSSLSNWLSCWLCCLFLSSSILCFWWSLGFSHLHLSLFGSLLLLKSSLTFLGDCHGFNLSSFLLSCLFVHVHLLDIYSISCFLGSLFLGCWSSLIALFLTLDCCLSISLRLGNLSRVELGYVNIIWASCTCTSSSLFYLSSGLSSFGSSCFLGLLLLELSLHGILLLLSLVNLLLHSHLLSSIILSSLSRFSHISTLVSGRSYVWPNDWTCISSVSSWSFLRCNSGFYSWFWGSSLCYSWGYTRSLSSFLLSVLLSLFLSISLLKS